MVDDVAGEEQSRPRVAGVVRVEWSELGPIGRTTLVALVFATIVAVVLAVSIPRLAKRYLMEAERDSLVRAVDDLTDLGLIPNDSAALDLEALVQDMAMRLPGREVVRVKIWTPDGKVIYSDAGVLVGNTFPLSDPVRAAFAGEPQGRGADLEQPDNIADRGFGELSEFYIPVRDAQGEVIVVYEVYERAGPVAHTVGDIRRYVLLSVTVSIGLLAVLLVALFLTHGVGTIRRRKQAERLLGELVRSQDKERAHTVGALHDEIGQPLYRILWGIEDCRARIEPGSPVDRELAGLGELAREVDARLRSELRVLNAGIGSEVDLITGLRELAAVTRVEAGLPVDIEASGDLALPPVNRAALLGAAREAIINVRKHAHATSVQVTVARHGDTVVVDIADDGVGMGRGQGLGIRTTAERLESIGGGLRVRQRRSGGTVFHAWVPTLGWEGGQ